MLFFHMSFAIGLIALVGGVSLYLWSVRAELGAGITLAKVVGLAVIILSILQLICTAYSSIRFSKFHREMRRNADTEMTVPAPVNPAPSSPTPGTAPEPTYAPPSAPESAPTSAPAQ